MNFTSLSENQLTDINGGTIPTAIWVIIIFTGLSFGGAIALYEKYGSSWVKQVSSYNPKYNSNDIAQWGGYCY